MFINRYPASFRNLMLMNFCWMSLSMAYFGLIYNTPTFGKDVRIVYVIPGFAFGWIVFFMPYLENTYGRCVYIQYTHSNEYNTGTIINFRKVMLVVSFALTGIPLFLTMVVPSDSFWVIIILAYAGNKTVLPSKLKLLLIRSY